MSYTVFQASYFNSLDTNQLNIIFWGKKRRETSYCGTVPFLRDSYPD